MADTWATVQEVDDLTGVTVSSKVLAQAQAQVEIRIGRVGSASSRIGTADLHWLRRAVAFQAAWLDGNPDVVSRLDLSSFHQDGAIGNVRADGMVLAPMARAALKRVSWRGTRSVHTASVYDVGSEPFYPASEGVVAIMEYRDDRDTWTPL